MFLSARIRIWPTFGISLLLVLLGAQPVTVHAERLPVRTYTTADGLERDNISRIVRDSRGFLWFCTVEGLSRFDGYRFTNYTTANGLPNARVTDILETRDGTYLVATANGVCRFNPRGTPLFSAWHPAEPGAQVVNMLLEDHTGQIWCGTEAGLYRIEQTNGELRFQFADLGLPRENFDSWLVDALIEDRAGTLWIGTRGSGLCHYFPDGHVERLTTAQGLPINRVTALLEDHERRLWVGTTEGLCLLVADPNPGRSVVAGLYTVKDGLTDNWVSTLFQSDDGKLLVGSKGFSESLINGPPDHIQFRRYTTAQGLSDNNIQAIVADRDGNLWLGTTNGGAMKIARNGFTTFAAADGLGDGEIFSIFQDQTAGTCAFIRDREHHEFIARFDGQRFIPIRLQLPAKIHSVGWGWSQQAFQDSAGEWWAPTGEGLYRFSSTSRFTQLAQSRPNAIYDRKRGLVTDDVFTLFEDSHHDVWIGSISLAINGLTRWVRYNETLHSFGEAEGLPAENLLPTSFGEDQAGNVWVGSSKGILARYRSGRFSFFTRNDGSPDGWIRVIFSDHSGRLWVAGYQGGVTRIDDPEAEHPTFVPYTIDKGLSSNEVDCITEDRWGRLYFGTGRGVDRLDPVTDRIKHYTAADGLVRGRVRFALRDRNGDLWFANETEVSRLIPEADRPELAPPILIDGLQIAGVSSSLSVLGQNEVGPLNLVAGQNQVSIDFVGLEFNPGEVLRYQHKLEGADRNWSAPSEQRLINYEHLAPGSYRFLVRAVTADGMMSERPAVVMFTIAPPFWRRWWFVTFSLALCGLLIYAIHHYRVVRLLELQQVRTRIATDLHDDIGSSLSRIAILSEVAKREMQGAPRDPSAILTDIAESARGAVDSMSDIVWAIDPRRDDLGNVVFRVRQFASDLLVAEGIAWKFQAPEGFDRVKLNPEQRRHIFLIFKEGINNAVRHAKCTSVDLGLSLVENRIIVEIHDNGRGFVVPSPGEVGGNGTGGHGLENLRRRATQLGGDLRIDSSPGGTSLRLVIPIRRSMT
jgi:ligand-binding sensor domain-containing protein/signal transduction histidine kinase